jgi:acetoacetate decarboxylase
LRQLPEAGLQRAGGWHQHGVVSASHFVTDLTLGLGEVVFDYLA